jgi:hypothetical protein
MRIILAVAILLVVADANATYMSGDRLHQLGLAVARNAKGTSTDEDVRNGFTFYGYIEGVLDSVNDKEVCVPTTVTIGQVGAMVSKFLDEHPEGWHYNASSVVVVALQSTFGCGKPK